MAPVGLVMTKERVIVTCNQTFCDLTQYEKPELIGASFEKLYSSGEEFNTIRDIGLEALETSGQYTDNRLLNRKDGTMIWCRFRARTLTPQSPLTQTILSYSMISDSKTQTSTLTMRERSVVSGMTRGLTSKQIAAELSISVRTVEDVRYRLLKKFKAKTSTDLLWQFINLEL